MINIILNVIYQCVERILKIHLPKGQICFLVRTAYYTSFFHNIPSLQQYRVCSTENIFNVYQNIMYYSKVLIKHTETQSYSIDSKFG